MLQTFSPCTLDDIETLLKVWETWTVWEDGSPKDLQRTNDPGDSPQYWLCNKCWDEFCAWPEVQQHCADAKTTLAALA
jgi:hypothetical protein